jgi:hypothetical protein
VLASPIYAPTTLISYSFVLNTMFFLGTIIFIRVTNVLTFLHAAFTYPVMLFLMKGFFPFDNLLPTTGAHYTADNLLLPTPSLSRANSDLPVINSTPASNTNDVSMWTHQLLQLHTILASVQISGADFQVDSASSAVVLAPDDTPCTFVPVPSTTVPGRVVPATCYHWKSFARPTMISFGHYCRSSATCRTRQCPVFHAT